MATRSCHRGTLQQAIYKFIGCRCYRCDGIGAVLQMIGSGAYLACKGAVFTIDATTSLNAYG